MVIAMLDLEIPYKVDVYDKDKKVFRQDLQLPPFLVEL